MATDGRSDATVIWQQGRVKLVRKQHLSKDRKPRCCAFVIGDTTGDDWGYCNAETVDGIWCRKHREQVYVTPGTDAYEHTLAGMQRAAKLAGRKVHGFVVDSGFEEFREKIGA
jgi:hypothetical protein